MAVATIERMIGLADRAALRPSELAEAYGQEAPARQVLVGCVALLTTTADTRVTVSAADPAWAARRLARSAAFERRGLFELDRRARFAFPDRQRDLESDVIEREEHFLHEVLSKTTLLEVAAPFPTDPTIVAAAIANKLS
jgi:hypothetical protein